MNIRYEYIHFVKIEDKGKTSVWECRNNRTDHILGHVRWHGPWRQYCYFPLCQAIYSSGCLADIQNFIKAADELRKRGG